MCLLGRPKTLTPWSVDLPTDPVHGLPYGPRTPFDPSPPSLVQTTPNNRRNVEVFEKVDSNEVSWIPCRMPYDPLDTIRLIQQWVDFLSYVWNIFELHSNCRLKERVEIIHIWLYLTILSVLNIHGCHERADKSCCFSWGLGRVRDRERRRLSRTK